MSLVAVDGHDVIGGTLALPRVGAWHADVDLDTTSELSGAVTIDVGGRLTLKGTISAGAQRQGCYHARIVGGADGLRKLAKPSHFVRPRFRLPLEYLLTRAGEVLASSCEAAVLEQALPAWSVIEATTGEQIAALIMRAAPTGTVWRLLPDGTLWVGRESWPKSAIPDGWRELSYSPQDGRYELGLDAATLLPGTTLGGERIDYCEHRISGAELRTSAWVAR